jgi:hypothetical protein
MTIQREVRPKLMLQTNLLWWKPQVEPHAIWGDDNTDTLQSPFYEGNRSCDKCRPWSWIHPIVQSIVTCWQCFSLISLMCIFNWRCIDYYFGIKRDNGSYLVLTSKNSLTKLNQIWKCDESAWIVHWELHFRDMETQIIWWDGFDDDRVEGYHLTRQVRELGHKLHGYQIS